ncbi:helix-turn-helix domain-containing protein [Streptomyces sp. NPDC042319]|uniref:helix-turn-helix domain-containing protein n=1 Tax=Streptomyces sp. NPDC042319 TaxID=3154332 RepID=UPI0033F1EDBC
MDKVFDSTAFAARDALAAWAEVTRTTVMPTTFRLVDVEVFSGWFKAMPLGPVQLSGMAYSSFCSHRTPKLIRVSDPETLQIALVRSGPHVIEQNRRRAPGRPGELLVFDSSRPFDSYADGEALLIQFPRELLPLRADHLAPLIASPLPGDKGLGRLLADFLVRLAEDGADYTPQDTARLGAVGLDLATAFLAHHTDRERDVPPSCRQRALYLRITSFVQYRLGDPTLAASDIAAAHHISVRSLHRLFQQHGTSIRTWIRGQRLERCRRDLADPLKRHVPIQAVAARWGFPRPADFTRAFRAHYGTTPSDYRNRTHRCGGTEPGTPGQDEPGTPGQGPGAQSQGAGGGDGRSCSSRA